MSSESYRKLAKVMDTLPNGYPATESGVELRILEHIYSPEEAEIFCDLRLSYETAEQISQRTGRPVEGLEDRLTDMWGKGQLFGIDLGGVKLFKMAPFIFGIYEFQLKHMTRELAELMEAYGEDFGRPFFSRKPQLMQVVPIEKEINGNQYAMPYEYASSIIEKGQSWGVSNCICKKEKELIGERCDMPMEVCLSIAPIPNFFNDHPLKVRPISKEEAYEILRKSEEAGLVHMTNNFENGQFYICNCCGCCCGVLKSINEYGISEAVNAHYYATIDGEKCIGCGVCADERCQINAITEADGLYRIDEKKCIGCALCVTTCPSEAIELIRKNNDAIEAPPKTENDWYVQRGKNRGVDFSQYQ